MKNWTLVLAVVVGGGAAWAGEPACDRPPAETAGPVPALLWGPVHPTDDGHYAPGEPDCSPLNNRVWFSLEFLMWWAKDSTGPVPLVSGAATQPGSTPLAGGLLLLGQQDVPFDTQGGLRTMLGYWFDPDQTFGIEAGFYFVGNRFIHNADADLIYCVASGDHFRLNALGGFRFFRVDEKLRLNNVTAGQGRFFGRNINFVEEFETRNQLFGGELGAEAEWAWDRLSATVTAKVGMGDMDETVNPFGLTNVLAPGNPAPTSTVTGGLFTSPASLVHHSQHQLGVLPGVGGNLSYRICDHLIGFAGYNFVYVRPVVLPGDQVNRAVSLAQVQGTSVTPATQPPFQFHTTDFWAHGVNFGIEISF